MKKTFFLMTAFCLMLSACGTSKSPSVPSAAAINPSPIAQANLQATAAVMAQQTLESMPSATLPPSNTPIVVTETSTATSTATFTPTSNVTATETQNPVLLTLTATLGTGTPDANIPQTIIPADMTGSPVSFDEVIQTETAYPRTYGTMPPYLPAGKVYLINNSNAEATISLHCTNKDGSVTYLEYPVSGKVTVKAPAGSYYYVAWVGGKKFTGNFRLGEGNTVMVSMSPSGVSAK